MDRKKTSSSVIRTTISPEEFYRLTRPLIGEMVSRCWRGYGSVIFLEIGDLHEETKTLRSGKISSSMRGEYTVMIEWGWRVEKPQSVYFSSWRETLRVIDNRLPSLEGRLVTGVDIEGRLPELVIELAGELWIRSFSMEGSEGSWVIFLDRLASHQEWFTSERGRLIRETNVESKKPSKSN